MIYMYTHIYIYTYIYTLNQIRIVQTECLSQMKHIVHNNVEHRVENQLQYIKTVKSIFVNYQS